MIRKYNFTLLIFFFFVLGTSVYAQQITISGKVMDSLQIPLSYANIIAEPEEDLPMAFSISDEQGQYTLKLQQNKTYTIIVSHLGYRRQVVTFTPIADTQKDFILQQATNQLEEVVLNYKIPVIVKKDTIVYNTDAFVSGQERKLRDILKKLPGIEVDREGNVTIRGKKVTKVLVEDKPFFTGDSKLAVNNIPADAVEQIEVLDNYNDIPMLKGLQESDDIAMNINLKEDKKKFAFGDIEAGAGYKERYLVHPKLFYYSPKTNVNLIGDFNNTGVKSFTFRDYLAFEGGFGKLKDDPGVYFSLFNSDFAQFLNNRDFTANTDQFGALNIRYAINNNTDISGYIISSKARTQTQSHILNQYLDSAEPFIEERTTTHTLNNFFTIGKITIDYDPSYDEDFAYNSLVKLTHNDGEGIIITVNPVLNNTITTRTDIKALNIKQNITYSRKLSEHHTATLESTYSYQKDRPFSRWITDQEILQGLIPLENDEIYHILQTQKSNSHGFNAIVKDYWVLNRFNHLYTSMGVNTAFSNFYNEDVQQQTNGTINNFASAGFGNDFHYNFINTFIGLEYKFQTGIFIFKPALYYHSFAWTTEQFKDRHFNHKILLLPQFTAKAELNNVEKIDLRYRLNARFPGINRLADNFILSSFNRVFRGNTSLENQLYHTASISYYKFSLFKSLNINAAASFNKRVKHFKNVTELNGIEQFDTPILFDEPEHSWTLNGSVSKKINNIRYKLTSLFSYNDFYQILNNSTAKNISKGISSTVSAETFFENFPNIEIGYTKDFSNYRSQGDISDFENDKFFAALEYGFFKDFIFTIDYAFNTYRNKTSAIRNTFDNANASLYYQKEESPWGFEIEATNLFDTKFKQQNSFNNFLITDQSTFILPRIVMFKASYKL